MEKCPQCNTDRPQDEQGQYLAFCDECGHKFAASSEPQSQPQTLQSETSDGASGSQSKSFEEYENDYVGRIGGNSNPQPRYNNSQRNGPYVGVSAAWWLLPIFFSFIGGIIAWAGVKDRDPRMAKNCLILGIILTVVPFAIGILFVFVISLPGMLDISR